MCEACGCSKQTEKTFKDKVAEVIEALRPALQSHGGDIELIDTDENNNVSVRLQGACQGCPGAKMTMQMGVERILREKVPEVKEVTAID